MKQISTLLFCLLTIVVGMAQNIDNGDFENWTETAGYKEPTGWKSNNAAVSSSGVAVTDTSDAHSGDSAVVVRSVYNSGIAAYISGILTNGSIHNDSLGMNGPSINYRPERFNGYYKYDAAPGDTAFVIVYMYRYDATAGKDSFIATGNARLTAQSTYTQFSFQILNADSNETGFPVPDSYTVLVLPTKNLSNPLGSALTLDNISFEGAVSAPSLLDQTEINIYPNPVEDHFVVSSAKHGIVGVSIMSAEGRQVQYLQNVAGSNDLMVHTNQLAKGFYYVQLQFDNGAVETRFITIVK